ncbi:MAG: neutral/alkaline non-lysosomal ceramidase N-terminal domain-containing protein [Pirellulales bacterium]
MNGLLLNTWFGKLIGAAVLTFALCESQGVAADELYSVGVAEVDITPDYPIRLHGFGGRRAESEGITQRIWAKALAIGTDEQKPVILFTVDNLGMRMSMVDEVAARLKEKAGIERQRIALTFTHSHTTPKVNGSADTIFSSPIPPEHQARIDRYTAELTDALEEAALAALADRKPASLEWSVGKVGFAMNRRTEGGPVDHDLPTLVVKTPEGEIRAVYVTYACHCVTLSDNKISGDWAGYAQEAIEHQHPGAIALVSIGCGSDSNPSSGVTGDNIGAAAEQGGEIAAEVDRLLRGQLNPVTGSISATLQNIELPLNKLPTREELEALATQDNPQGYNAKFQLAKLDRGETLQAAIDYPIQTFAFGDSLAMVFLAGEVCVDYSHRLKEELDQGRVWLHGYANDFCCYVPSERLVGEGGYGGGAETVYFALPATLQPGLEDKIVAEVRRQLPQFLNPNPPKKVSRFEPTPPKDALAAIQLGNGLIAELVASEPLVVDPVAIDFGADGKLWVAEMRDYTREVDEEFDQSGSVRFLKDRDGDGKYDEATVFVSGLRFPTDVKVWRKGVIVCDAPDVIYLEDTDGDGKADLRKILLMGFETHNAQARVNSLRWGLDNWLYGSCGLFGGSIRSFNGQQLELGGRDFRFKPDSGEMEAVSGRTHQGRVRDDWGNWFGCENGVLAKHYPLTDHYLARNPYVIAPATEQFVPTGPDPNRLFPIGKPVLFKESGPPGRPTSACGLEIYRDELLGAEFYGNAFVAEPVNQLVHRLVLTSHGVSFQGRRADEETDREFLASTDHWFRPVQIRTGLDGCLWIVDMCRYVIEHPRFIPEETLRTLDVRAGNTAGRIYRVRPASVAPRVPKQLHALDTAELVAEMDSPNGPYRDLVHQQLIERADKAVVPLLDELATNAKRPATRLQAVCTLDGLSALSEAALLRALQDPAAVVRRHAIRLSEPFLDTSPTVFANVLELIEDDDPQIQLQIAYSLGQSQAAEALAELAWRHRSDPYLQAAVLSSISADNAAEVLHGMMPRITAEELPPPLRTTVVTVATKLGGATQLREMLLAISQSGTESLSIPQLSLLADLLESSDAEVREQIANDSAGAEALARVVVAARIVLRDAEQNDEAKLVALRTVSAAGTTDRDLASAIGPLLGVQSSPAVQQATVKYLALSTTPAAGDLLLANWGSYSPDTRLLALDALLSRTELLPMLLENIEQGAVSPSHLDTLQRQRLLQHADAEIRAAANRAFAGAIDPNRQTILNAYAPAANLSGDATHGRELFRKHCANCHRLEEHGYVVGPDLAALTNRSAGAMLEAIFDPNRTVDQRYQSYTAVTDEGRVFTGILASEDSNSVTLLEQAGKQHTLLRNSLEEFQNTRVSIMPEGFEKDLSTSDVADLFAYVAAQGQPPKQFPGNEPKLVKPLANGSIALLAVDCEIYGPHLVFEASFKNVGYWNGPDDHIAWNVELSAPGEYDVYLDASCANDSAGNVAVIDGFASPLEATIPGTGGWDKYESLHVGRSSLPAGRNRIVIHPGGSDVKNAVMDLRGLHLVSTTQADNPPAPVEFDPAAADDAALAIHKLLEGLAVGTPREYKQIPAIFREAIAAGKRNQDSEMRRVLQLSVPHLDEPAQHWQVVVVGGGIVNGLTQVGIWPRPRIAELLEGDEQLQQRWARLIELSVAMADDEAVPNGTRYDALRILGADTFEKRGAHLIRYLQPKVGTELQMGGVSGIADIDHDLATNALIDHFANFEPGNRDLAIDGLLRNEGRVMALLTAMEREHIPREALADRHIQHLTQLKNQALRGRAQAILKRQ